MKVIKQIPNTITCLYLLSGIIAILFSFEGRYDLSFYAILVASVFDFCDGFAARLLHSYSDMGKELDSLSDVVSFGLAPSLILFNFYSELPFESPYNYLKYITLLIAIFSALRLAKFNIDTRQSSNFIGLPTPASAILISSLIAFSTYSPLIDESISYSFVIPLLSIFISYLLISEIDFFSLKIKSFSWQDNSSRYLYLITTLLLSALMIVVLKIDWTGIVFVILFYYIIWNLMSNILPLFSNIKRK
jgi:CDP-diacylglycerol---serine O-phosphatidyltransferase